MCQTSGVVLFKRRIRGRLQGTGRLPSFFCFWLGTPRGPNFAIDLTTSPKLAQWLNTVLANDAVKATLADSDALCGTYKRYADNTALSKVGGPVCMLFAILGDIGHTKGLISQENGIRFQFALRCFVLATS